MTRRMLLVFLGAAAVCLAPWIVYLAHTLPDRYDTGRWRTAWVGFDIALLCCFAGAAWLGLRRRRAAVPLLAATAALLCCDAWFDVVLDWTSSDRWTSVALAAGAEVPTAVLLLLAARRLLADRLPDRPLTVRDIEIYHDPSARRILAALPSTVDNLAGETGLPASEIATTLRVLAADGYAREGRDGRWSALPQSVLEPRLEEIAEPHRTRMAQYLDAKYERELKLLAWAAEHRGEFGPWGKASRAAARLTEADLRAFEAEYRELLAQYCQLRRHPAPGVREVAVRFYAFPPPALD
ncbi:winged helix-turn-helix domain-containing protein [Amycolatopsis sp. GM8]|uniref:winged helix-turn-helix domain-containing protein n=1 Tax=Amycolatopsis sp. GM8 TaxID=2896530 RepID=UPI001F387849|nr:winged helix-turn-helix domain-containing protein [Amycolatopsis sp. GM8]